MSEALKLAVREVIGSNEPLGDVMTMCLGIDWSVPKGCLMGLTGEPCDKPHAFLYVLEQPLVGFGGPPEGFSVVGICREHDRVLRGGGGTEDTKP